MWYIRLITFNFDVNIFRLELQEDFFKKNPSVGDKFTYMCVE